MKKVIGTGLVLCLVASACSVSCAVPPGLSANEKSATAAQKPLSENTVKELAYLVGKQLDNGGWSEGEESACIASVGKINRESANVADTCMAPMALVRAGNLPDKGSMLPAMVCRPRLLRLCDESPQVRIGEIGDN